MFQGHQSPPFRQQTVRWRTATAEDVHLVTDSVINRRPSSMGRLGGSWVSFRDQPVSFDVTVVAPPMSMHSCPCENRVKE